MKSNVKLFNKTQAINLKKEIIFILAAALAGLAIGGMLFAILLITIYSIRAKQTNIDNKIYKVLVVGILPVILTEICAVALIYHFPNNEILGDLACKVYSFVLITWLMLACAYIITLGNAYKYTKIKDIIHGVL